MKTMKLMTKYLLFLMILTLSTIGCSQNSTADNSIIEYLKKNNFNLEIYELAFCVEEILYILDEDTSYIRKLEEKIGSSFTKRNNSSQKYFHFKELQLLKNKFRLKDADLGDIIFLESTQYNNPYESYAELVNNYTEYPEQIDDIFLIFLVCNFEEKAWNDIMNNKIAYWKFNNWIDYGFIEFRYYMGTKNAAKGILNERIIEYIQKNETNHKLVKRSLDMFNTVQEKFKK